MPKEFPTPEERARQNRERQNRERAAIREAKRTGRGFSYVDDDGCEVTVTPSGHSFYNVGDWY